MLVISRLLRSGRRRSGDDGVVLVAVVVVMLVGFVIASAIAASVLFTIRANVANRSTTQAFIAAESGRDKVVSQIANGCADDSVMHQGSASGSSPQYDAQAYTTTGGQPISSVGMALSCPTKDTTYVLIHSTGTGPDGSTSAIDSVYRWTSTYSNVPGGVVTYFSGSVSQGVAHYTGDLVLRNGDWSCIQNGVLDGDLYVLTGTVSFSNTCTIRGDVWSNGYVQSNSSGWKVQKNTVTGSPGNITTNGQVVFDSNGNPSVDGSISAGGAVKLTAAGGGHGTVGGTVTSKVGVTLDTSAWTTGTPTQNTGVDPTFVPTLAWLRAATKWIDLNNSSGWGVVTPADCSKAKNSGVTTPYVQGMFSGSGPLVLDFTGCGKAVNIDLAAVALNRDVAIIVGPDDTMSVSAGGLTASSPHQLLFIHSDGNLDDRDVNGDPQPTCGASGTRNQQDTFGTTGAIDSNINIMVYSACGLNGTVTASFSGQLYANDTTDFHAGSSYTCKEMSWPSALTKLGCKIKGPGGIIDDTTIVQKLGSLIVQTEQ